MIQGILVMIGYGIASFIADCAILGTIGHQMGNRDKAVGVPEEDSLASPVFVVFSIIRVCGLLYLIKLLFDGNVPIPLVAAIAILELYRGIAQMYFHDDINKPSIRNYYTGKTIGSFIGLIIMTYWIYFK